MIGSGRKAAGGTALNASNLERLGAGRLAALLIEVSTGDAAVKRRLRLALAGSAGPAEAARAVSKRLASVARAQTWLDAERIRVLVADLSAQHRAIVSVIAPAAPREAFELAWQLAECADPVFARSDDGSGRLAALFEAVVRDLGPLARAAAPEPAALAGRAMRALRNDRSGLWYELVPVLAGALGEAGLRALEGLLTAWRDEAVAPADRCTTGRREQVASGTLRQIAIALGDVDAYVAGFGAGERRLPDVAADIARHLLAAGRAQAALDALEAVPAARRGRHGAAAWDRTRAETLDALGRPDEAQAFRWACFCETLDADRLREHLRRLPDFEDFEAEQRAMAHALGHADLHRALAFLVGWPDLERAGALVVARAGELDGYRDELLGEAVERLAARHPLAATLLGRAIIDHALETGRSSCTRHAARQWQACAALAPFVADFGTAPDHAAYARSVRERHGRRDAFWATVGAI